MNGAEWTLIFMLVIMMRMKSNHKIYFGPVFPVLLYAHINIFSGSLCAVFNIPCAAGAVLQTPLLLID